MTMTLFAERAKAKLSKLVLALKTRRLGRTLRHYGVIGRMAVSQRVTVIKMLGLRQAGVYLQEKTFTARGYRGNTKNGATNVRFLIAAPGLKFPLEGRSGTSDILVYEQMFVQHEYACLPDVGAVKTIVDCGANVGYASAYLLSRFPEAQIISIEPDSGNFAMLQKNTAPYGERAHLVQAGVWSHSAELVIRREAFGGSEWGFTVEECPPGQTPDVKAVGLGELMTQYQLDTIDILKVDIEGSEKVVFASNYENWINRVRVLVLELHGPDCERIVQNAIAHRKHTISRYQELTMYHFTDN